MNVFTVGDTFDLAVADPHEAVADVHHAVVMCCADDGHAFLGGIDLATQGLPRGHKGFEIFDDSKLGVTEFQNKVDKGLLTTSVAQVQYQKLQQQQQEYQQYAVRKQQEMAEEQQVMMNQIANAIAEYVVEYNATHQYALILTTAGGILPTPVVTGDPSLDITEDLLAGLNAAYIKTKDSAKK